MSLNLFGARQKYFSYDYLLTLRELDQKGYAKARQDFEDSERKIETIFRADDPSLIKFVRAYADVHDVWQAKVGDEEFRLGKDPATWEQARSLLKGDLSQQLSDESRATGTALMAAVKQWSDHWRQAYAGQLAFLRLVVVLGLLAGVGAAALVSWLIHRGVTRPLVVMASAMKRLAAGDQAASVPALDRTDEIGELAGAMQAFKQTALEQARLESDAAAARRDAERERQSNEESRAETGRQLALVVSSVATGLARLSAGDLVFRLTEPLAPDYEQVRIDFNATVAKLQDTMAVIATSAAAIRAGMAEISSASEDLSKRTEQQAAGLEETAAALDEITATVGTTAEGADQARNAVAAARNDAERSGEVVQNAVAAMAEIEQSSKQISQIIGVIDEIAFQTNLLALNAGVEAARAGDSGKGFAVVASEVRGLAQRSADAAKEIKALISASSRQVGAGVELVGETGKTLQRIVTQIADINAIVVDIAASAKEQASGLHQVNTAVNQMDQVTQQNAAMVEQSNAASHALEDETMQLEQLVARFDVGEVRVQARSATRAVDHPQRLRRIA